MGSATILYCGADECLRIPVLRVAGFRVARCASSAELTQQLEDTPEIAAILFEERRGRPADDAADRARERSVAALVLFRHPAGDSCEQKFDLVIDPATPPAGWLRQVADLVLAQATPGWAQIARQLRSRRHDLPADDQRPASSRGFRIQPERRNFT